MNLQIPAIPAALLRRLTDAGFEAYAVGGCVRDALLGRQPHDWDLCTSALPHQTLALFSDYQVVETGLQHGTVMIVAEGEGYEITTFRTDGTYSDGRHPDQVTFVSNLKEDLSRRDFTINAMAYHPDTGLADYFNGEEDLRRGIIRCVGDPDLRFQEDGLRILRALRFAARFGFPIANETSEAIHCHKDLLDKIAAERIFSELKGFLQGREVESFLRTYRDVFALILPPLADMFDFPQHTIYHCYDVWEHTIKTVEAADPDPMLRLAALFHDCGKPSCHLQDPDGTSHFFGHERVSVELAEQMLDRLRCDNLLKDQVLLQVKYHDLPLPSSRKEGLRFLQKLKTPQQALDSIKLHEADLYSHAPDVYQQRIPLIAESRKLIQALADEQACYRVKDLAVTGRDLIQAGMKPGPDMGKALDHLLELVIDGHYPNEKDILLGIIDQLGK